MTAPTTYHFDLCVVAALASVLDGVFAMVGGRDAAVAQFPFLGELQTSLRRTEPGTWDDAVLAFEAANQQHLPLRALCTELGLDARARAVIIAVGLPEDDARFGALFDALQHSAELGRLTLGTLLRWWGQGWPELRPLVQRLIALGVLDVTHPEAPAASQALRVPPALWAALHGDPLPPGPVTLRPSDALLALGKVLLAPDVYTRVLEILAALASGDARGLLVRGPPGNGRRTLLGAVARKRGLVALDVDATRLRPDDPAWRSLGVLAVALRALPILRLEPGPGERVSLRALAGYRGPVGLVLGVEGAVEGPPVDAALSLALPIPPPELRRVLWQRSLALPDDVLDQLAARHRLTTGAIVRVAAQARLLMLARRGDRPTLADVTGASAEVRRDVLELLAAPIPVQGDWSALALPRETLQDLRAIESLCLRREQLPARTGPALRQSLRPGVRALLQGPSGTGKTLAARTLAAVLGKQLYRVELAAVVSKYIGETEKNLHLLFAHAEALDVVLLLDEGDALLGRRTAVQSSNDRYANLETNYLLQRIESFQGILVVTTNAADQIDSAFHRRMDVVVDFRPPEPAEREVLWQLHLPEQHAVDPLFLREVVARCALSGGQIRNAALAASLLALEEGPALAIAGRHLEEAVFREYRKAGSACPLRRRDAWTPVPPRGRPGPADHAWSFPPGLLAAARSTGGAALTPTRVLPRVLPDPDPKNPWGFPVIGGLCLKAENLLSRPGDLTLALEVVLPMYGDDATAQRLPIVGTCQLNSESWQLVLDDATNHLVLEVRFPVAQGRPISATYTALYAPARATPLRLVLARRGDDWILPAGTFTPAFPVNPPAGHLWIGAGVVLGGSKNQTFFDGLIIRNVALWFRALSTIELAAIQTGDFPQ